MARNEIRCSFCGKTESQVMKLLKGPNGVYICDACVELCSEIIEEELNVKEVKFTDDVREFTTYTFKPQLKTVGPKYGKQLGGIKEYLANVDGNEAMDKLNAGENLVFDVNGTEVSLSLDDVLVEMSQKEGYMSEADNTVTVVLLSLIHI